MTQQRGTATSQLSTVITALQLGQKTGILTIERGETETFEEGRIVFVHGKIIEAAIGSYTVRDAATQLFSWQACCFSFTSLLPTDSTMAALCHIPKQKLREFHKMGTRLFLETITRLRRQKVT